MKSLSIGRAAAVFLGVLTFPAFAVPSEIPTSAPTFRYTVKPGDNLIRIAENYFVRPDAWRKVQQVNQVADPHRMRPGTVLRIPVNLLRKAPGQAVIENVRGAVRWRGAASDWAAAVNGQKLDAGAVLETPEGASVVLVLADGSRIVVSPGSRLSLDSLTLYADGVMADTRLRLDQGQADIRANPQRRGNQHLIIQTPSAQAVVRGTEFRMGADEMSTREETLGGLVSVEGAGRQVAVGKGLGTLAQAGKPPLKPVPLLLAGNTGDLPARFEFLPMRFSLPPLTGAVGWQGDIAPDRSFERILLSRSADGKTLSFTDLPNGDYVLRLRAVDANGLRGLDALHAFTVFARPFPPGLSVPGDGGVVRETMPRFSWNGVVDITRYRIQISTSPDFSAVLHDELQNSDSWRAPQALPAGKLYWRAASLGDDGQQGPWSRPATFTYKPGPGAADLGRTALEIDSEKVRLHLPSPPEGLYYEALLSADKDMATVVAQMRSDDGRFELISPSAGSYFLGIRLVDRSDNTPGPYALQKIEIPHSRLWLLPLLLIPLAL